MIFPANLLTGAKHSAFLTNHLANTSKNKQISRLYLVTVYFIVLNMVLSPILVTQLYALTFRFLPFPNLSAKKAMPSQGNCVMAL